VPSSAAVEEDDYALALRLQREFDEQERLAAAGGYIVRGDDEEEEEMAEVQQQREDEEEAFAPPSVLPTAEGGAAAADTTELDADFALALALQAEFADKANSGPAPSPYRREPNEKGTTRPLSRPGALSCAHALAYLTLLRAVCVCVFAVSFESRAHNDRKNWAYLDNNNSDEEDDDYDDYDSDYHERYNNPHAPTSYNGCTRAPSISLCATALWASVSVRVWLMTARPHSAQQAAPPSWQGSQKASQGHHHQARPHNGCSCQRYQDGAGSSSALFLSAHAHPLSSLFDG
jgi:hypothetical protein